MALLLIPTARRPDSGWRVTLHRQRRARSAILMATWQPFVSAMPSNEGLLGYVPRDDDRLHPRPDLPKRH